MKVKLWIPMATLLGAYMLMAEGNPQWGKCFYLFQADFLNRRGEEGIVNRKSEARYPCGVERSFVLTIPNGYVGAWRDWNSEGKLRDIYWIDGDGMAEWIYDDSDLVPDRRREYGVEIDSP